MEWIIVLQLVKALLKYFIKNRVHNSTRGSNEYITVLNVDECNRDLKYDIECIKVLQRV